MPFVADRAMGWPPVTIDVSWGLRDISNGYAYTICKSLLCNNCSFIFLDIRFGEKELISLYKGYREKEYTLLRERYEPNYSIRNEVYTKGSKYIEQIESFLEPYVPENPSVLDWGGDTGKNTPFKERAFAHHVYDISQAEPVNGVKGVTKEEISAHSYDLIVLSNVLEHVPYLQSFLKEVTSFVTKDTILYIEVPQEEIVRTIQDPIDRLQNKRHWHEHVNFFSEESLIYLLSKCNLKIIQLSKLNVIVENRSCWIFSVICKLKV